MRRWRDNADAPSHANATRKVALGITSRRAAMVVDGLLERAAVDTTRALFVRAVVLQNRFGLHYYDAAICQAASRGGYCLLFSEDLSSEQVYDGMMVLTPIGALRRLTIMMAAKPQDYCAPSPVP